MVFGHGFEYQEAAKSVAPDFPDTVFITTSGNTVLDNVASIVFELEEVTYLLGSHCRHDEPDRQDWTYRRHEHPTDQ